jgi:hypothetical protein
VVIRGFLNIYPEERQLASLLGTEHGLSCPQG